MISSGMSDPPSAALESMSSYGIADGVKPFSSATSDTDVPDALMLAVLIPFVIYNIATLFDLELAAVVNFGMSIYHASTDWVRFIHQDILTAQNISVQLQGILLTIVKFSISIYKPTINRIKFTQRSVRDSRNFRTALNRLLSNRVTHPSQTVTVEAITVTGGGIIAIIRGLPSDLSAPEIRRFLETALYIQYQPELQLQRTTTRSDPNNTAEAAIDISHPGLWEGTSMRSTTSSVPTSGIHTPTSDTFVSGASNTNGSTSPASASNPPAPGVPTPISPTQPRFRPRHA